MDREEFADATKHLALSRQQGRCASCGTAIHALGMDGRKRHKYGEAAQAHHIVHAKGGGGNELANCVILCNACHASAHEGGRYRTGTVMGRAQDYPHFKG